MKKKFDLSITPQQKLDVGTKSDEIITILVSPGVSLVLSTKEMKPMMKWSVANESFVREMLKIGKKYPAYCPSEVDLTDFANEIAYVSTMKEFEIKFLGMAERAGCSKVAIEDQCMKMALAMYSRYCDVENQGEEALKEDMVEAHKRWEKTKGDPPPIYSIAAGGVDTKDRIATGSRFVNEAETVLVVHKGTVIGNEGKTVYPGETLTIPAGWTTITIQNKGTVSEGKFSVRQIN